MLGTCERDREECSHVAAIAYLAVVIIGFAFGRMQVRLVGLVGEGFLRDLRVRVFAHLQRLPMAFHDREPTGKLVARMTSDIDAITDLVQIGLVAFVTNGLLIALSIVVLLLMSPMLGLASLVGFPFVVMATKRFRRRSDAAYLTLRDRIGATMSSLQEGLSGVRVVQASAREDDVIRTFGGANRAQYEANMKATRISAEYFPVVEFAGDSGHCRGRGFRRRAGPPGQRVGRDRRRVRALPREPVRTCPAAESAVQHRAVLRGRRCASCSGCSTRTTIWPTWPARSTCLPVV